MAGTIRVFKLSPDAALSTGKVTKKQNILICFEKTSTFFRDLEE